MVSFGNFWVFEVCRVGVLFEMLKLFFSLFYIFVDVDEVKGNYFVMVKS